MAEIRLHLNDQKWTEGTSATLLVTNLTENWCFFKIKGAMDSIGLVSVLTNKGTIRPHATEKIVFKLHVDPGHLSKGDSSLMFLFKWKCVNLDKDHGSFLGLDKMQRFSLIVRNGKAFVTPPKMGDQRRSDDLMVDALMMRFEPYVAPEPETLMKPSLRESIMFKLKLFMVVSSLLMIYWAYRTASNVAEDIYYFFSRYWNMF